MFTKGKKYGIIVSVRPITFTIIRITDSIICENSMFKNIGAVDIRQIIMQMVNAILSFIVNGCIRIF